MKIFNSIGHFFAWVVSKAIPAASQVVQTVETEATSPLAGAIVSLMGAKGASVQSGVVAIAGDVLSAFQAAGAAIGAGGLNVTFDEVTVASIKTLYGDLAGLFGKAAPAAASAAPATAAPAEGK